MSNNFAQWIANTLVNDFFMEDIHIRQNENGIYRIESAN